MDYIVKGSIFLSIATIIKAMTKLGLFVEVFDKCDDEEIEVRITNIGNNQKTAFDFKYSVMVEQYRNQRRETEFNKTHEREIIKNRCKRLAINEYIKRNDITLIV